MTEFHQYLRILIAGHLEKARSERGASAVEWVVITGLVIGICIAVGAILMNTISDGADQINLGGN
ncbi:MAG TPA: hypothetical protein VMF51_25415 [Nocardioides sp.]|jgi:Flp pilus assembly pilin Flp|uniref:hypothetical protein n=1 Tax=Nocardioides sp. TaxID=35761 RepID=UPI002CE7A891|nr:hypothetical protein [Nocardioides sp.]HTW18490.1 hypothetical protein [Nocardioides sp.]